MTTNDQQFLAAVDRLEKTAAAVRTEAAAGGVTAICTIYKDLKPILTAILPFIEHIPVWGKTVANGIRALVAALDALCAG